MQPFDISTFRTQGHQLIDQLADYLDQQISGTAPRVLDWQQPDQAYDYWKQDFETGDAADLKGFFAEVLNQSMHVHHPKYVGHQVAAPFPLGALAGMVSSLLNNGMALYEMGPVSSAMERIVMEKMAEVIGYGEGASGLMTSGGTLSNLIALLCARSVKAKEDVWQSGTRRQYAIMVSEQAHYCVDRAVRIMGWGREGVILVPSDKAYHMRTYLLPDILDQAKKEGKEVIAIVGSACTTSTGSYDDLEAIADFCEKEDIWMHVDGAHGAAAIFSEEYKKLVKGLNRADSITLDFHKMMGLPALSTALMFKRERDSFQTFAQKAQYLWEAQEEPEWYNYGKRTLECTKRMISLGVYTLWRTYGSQVFTDQINQTYTRAREFADDISQAADFELSMIPESNIVCFRWRPEGVGEELLDELNAQIRMTALEKGEFYLVQTRLNTGLWLRTTLMNAYTSRAQLKSLLAHLRQIGTGLIKGTNASSPHGVY